MKQLSEKKKMGRPTNNPKNTMFSIRFDRDTLDVLDSYCRENSIQRAEGVRRAVRKLKREKQEVTA